jgi:hypothetical protein
MVRDWELIRIVLIAAESKAPGEVLQPSEIVGIQGLLWPIWECFTMQDM